MAQVLFWQAVSECYPNHPALERRPWINAWRIRLAPELWSEEQLFQPSSARRPLGPMRGNFTGIFAPQGLRELVLFEWPYRMLRWGRGFAYYRLVPIIHRLVWVNKPAMWARKVMIRDYAARMRN